MTVQLTLLCQPAAASLRAGVFPSAIDAQVDGRDEPALRDVDYGRWAGRSLKAVADTEPDAFASWLADPDFDGHGGESLSALRARVAQWLMESDWREGGGRKVQTLAVVPANVVKACVLHVLDAPSTAFRHLDIAPASKTVLSMRQGHWRLQL
ncbi:histidine phosphatase family protein [Cupriavidus plantarum]|uniref:histidine phosphatase family protein n=1 Tax=Cupriavidus plantarum TaxID=942865 RepID=UPI000EAFD562|nr:histidine phosphatase family protein [Cupriavidus plantarum]RLK39381.1 histidine phosphatase superfamily protein (branch 1) [Cupriavidus plantarum]CAG2133863.1 hypothetical protein LMG26296_01903 [Cupriavidus plantarum]SMR84289.1 Histidine phosphatase superfamily (branch 1) [Cupriavidus plantarum]